MTETVRSTMAPQGDRFEDQYTSATADLSAGGVAAAVEAMQENPEAAPAVRPPYGTPVRPTVTATAFPVPEPMALSTPRGMGLGAGVLLAVSGGVGGAWLYARWQRERNKPINRLILCYPCWVKSELEKDGWKEGQPHPDECHCEGINGHPDRRSTGN